MIPCMICKERPAVAHLNTGEDSSRHLWVCDECSPIQHKRREKINEFQEWVRLLRLNHEKSLRFLSEKTGINIVKLCDYENGYIVLSEEDKIKIFNAFTNEPVVVWKRPEAEEPHGNQ